MIVHLAASAFNLKNDIQYIQKISDIIYSRGDKLALNWFEPANNEKIPRDQLDWTRITKNHLEAIARSDIVIMEGSTYSFHHGFQMHFALTHKKPVLFLFRAHGGRYPNFEGLFISGITDELLTTEVYNNIDDLEETVNNFINLHNIPRKKLTMELSQDDIQRLTSISRRTNKTADTVIHDLLNKEHLQ